VAQVVPALVARAVRVDPVAPGGLVARLVRVVRRETVSVSRGLAMGNRVTGRLVPLVTVSVSRGLVTESPVTAQLGRVGIVRCVMVSVSRGLAMGNLATAQQDRVAIVRSETVSVSRGLAMGNLATAQLGRVAIVRSETVSVSRGLAMESPTIDPRGTLVPVVQVATVPSAITTQIHSLRGSSSAAKSEH
jgi:hypothetical protein